MSQQRDAHVRAREALLKKVVDRMFDWGVGRHGRQRRKETWEQEVARMRRMAARRLALFQWPPNWGDKMSPYAPYGPRQVKVGDFRDVPAHVVHAIMCVQVPKAEPGPGVESGHDEGGRVDGDAERTGGLSTGGPAPGA